MPERQIRHDDIDCTCHQGAVLHRYRYAGVWWHSATIETVAANRAYALAASGGDQRYADAIGALLA